MEHIQDITAKPGPRRDRNPVSGARKPPETTATIAGLVVTNMTQMIGSLCSLALTAVAFHFHLIMPSGLDFAFTL
jgi:hypothetical protein